jgi:hypothetical protein
MFARSGAFIWTLLLGPSCLIAFNVDDVLDLSKKGYGERQVIEIIRAQGLFDLQAEDIARLKAAEVGEPVIRALVEKVQLALTEKYKNSGPFQFLTKIAPQTDMTRHPSWSIVSGSAELLTFRDDAGYLNTRTRAEVVARRLNQALVTGAGKFTAGRRGGQSCVIFQSSRDLVIVSVSDREIAGADVTKDKLAADWAGVLNHYWESLPSSVLYRLPAPVTLKDMILLAKVRIPDETALAFFHSREFDINLQPDEVKSLKATGVSEEVIQYVLKRMAAEPDITGSRRYSSQFFNDCRQRNITFLGSSAARSGGFSNRTDTGMRSGGTAAGRSGGSRSPKSGVPGKNFGRSGSTRSRISSGTSN